MYISSIILWDPTFHQHSFQRIRGFSGVAALYKLNSRYTWLLTSYTTA